MNRINEIAGNALYSEKAIDKYLCNRVAELRGKCLKYDNPHDVGYPDRLVILPGKPLVWCELKSHGKKPREIQNIKHRQLKLLGQQVYVIDSREGVDNMIKEILYGNK